MAWVIMRVGGRSRFRAALSHLLETLHMENLHVYILFKALFSMHTNSPSPFAAKPSYCSLKWFSLTQFNVYEWVCACINRLFRGKGVSIYTDVDPDHDEGIFWITDLYDSNKIECCVFVLLFVNLLIFSYVLHADIYYHVALKISIIVERSLNQILFVMKM